MTDNSQAPEPKSPSEIKHQTVSITVTQDDNELTIDRSIHYEWPGYPRMQITSLIREVATEAVKIVEQAERAKRISTALTTKRSRKPIADDFDEED